MFIHLLSRKVHIFHTVVNILHKLGESAAGENAIMFGLVSIIEILFVCWFR